MDTHSEQRWEHEAGIADSVLALVGVQLELASMQTQGSGGPETQLGARDLGEIDVREASVGQPGPSANRGEIGHRSSPAGSLVAGDVVGEQARPGFAERGLIACVVDGY